MFKSADKVRSELGIDTFKFYISNELVNILNQNETVENKDQQLYNVLDSRISQIELDKTFTKKVALHYHETLNEEIIIALVKWFNKKCCKIENVVLVTSTTLGLKEWCVEYCKLMNKRMFAILEVPFSAVYIGDLIRNFDKSKILDLNCNVEYVYDYYGGLSAPNPDKDYLAALLISEANFGFVDYKCGFSEDIQFFNNYLEQITGFGNRLLCDKLLLARRKYNAISKIHGSEEKEIIGRDAFINADTMFRSFCNVIRESFIDQNINVITEKTIKCFLNKQFAMPIGYNAVARLEKLGFKFLHDVIDYSYQTQSLWYNRSLLLVKELNRLHNTYNLSELTNIKNARLDILNHNYDHIISGDLYKLIQESIIL